MPEGPPPLIFVVSPQLIRLPGRNATMGDLASVMQRAALDYPVLDKTGLTARYDFDLEFTPDETVFGGTFGRAADDSAKPDLTHAISQQLGLRLQATRGPVEALVIDHVGRLGELRQKWTRSECARIDKLACSTLTFNFARVPLIRISLAPLVSRMTSRPSSWVAPGRCKSRPRAVQGGQTQPWS
jgi:hypothetical protein